MKMKKYIKYIVGVMAILFAFNSCVKDLDTVPIDKDVVTSASVYTDDVDNYKMVLAKLYAGLAVSGQEGPSGMGDISGLDEGFGQYLRGYWYMQELPTDEALIAWNDGNLRDLHDQDWSPSNEFVTAFYYRIYYQIALCNEFIRETTETKLNDRGVSGEDKTTIEGFRAEARFLRALSYWHALDLFGSVPFVTEDDPVGSFFPEQITRADLFSYIESELKALESLLPDARTNEYARADKGAAWMLLAKLYLNSEVYTGNPRYTDAITYSQYVIDAGYQLEDKFENLFLADNHLADGVIFPITFDGTRTKTWGGTTFIIHAAVGGSMTPGDFGIDGGWGGLRTTEAIVSKFMDTSGLTKGKFVGTKASYNEIFNPGEHNGWDPGTANALGSYNDDGIYEGYQYFVASEGFKFTPLRDWSSDWGDNGADGTLDPGGSNITVSETGFYRIVVDLNTLTYTLTKTDWGIIGSSVDPFDWSADQNLTFDPVTGDWTIIATLRAGEFKFRANDAWSLDYGDNGADGFLEAGGSNIQIATAGKYLITLTLETPDYTYTVTPFASDERNMFYSDGQSIKITDIFEFTEGYAVTKFRNVTSTGAQGSDLTFTDTDFPLFRVADAYLTYAEAVLRGGTGGSASTALDYVNLVISRAYGGDTSENIGAGELTLDFILDERAREFLWEAQRRTDLVRFGKFSNTTYLWAWKGGQENGVSVDSKYDMFPLPSSDLGANPKLTQNGNY